jgi:hypothetical protein
MGTANALSGNLEELFNALQPIQLSTGWVDYVCLAITNNSTTDHLLGARVFFSAQTSNPTTRLEICEFPDKKNGGSSMTFPFIGISTDAPVGVTFVTADSLATSIDLGTIERDKYTVIGLKRIVSPGTLASTDTATLTVTNEVP